MKVKHITIREAVSEQDSKAFWEQLRSYQIRDIFPDPEDEEMYQAPGFTVNPGITQSHL